MNYQEGRTVECCVRLPHLDHRPALTTTSRRKKKKKKKKTMVV